MFSQIFKVLIVDDSDIFRTVARKMINENFRVKIYEAANAFEAMRILGNNPIDIILLDVNMPEVDGFKAAKIIKHQEKYTDIPIIFCTALMPTKEVIEKSFEVGAIDFLNKPFTESEIVRILSLYFRFILREREINSKLAENQIRLQNEIEERKQLSQTLLESEEKFRKISASAYDSIIMIDQSNYISFWNEAASRIFGYSADDVANIDFIKLISPPGKYQINKITFENIKKTSKDKYPTRHFEISAIRKGGELIDLDISVSAVEVGTKENYIIIARDITIKKRAAELLQKSEAMLADAEATAHIGSWEYSIEKGETIWSKELYNIYALDPANTIASIDLISGLMNESDEAYFKSTFENTIETGNPFILEVQISTADGRRKFVEGKGRPIFDSTGKVVKLVGTLMDITEKKYAQQKMEEYLAELKESNATKDKFFSIIAHDLRNPLGAIKNLTEIMNDMYAEFSEEEKIELIGSMKEAAHKLFELLENLLTWSRSQRGNIQFYPDDVYIHQITNNSLELLSDNAKQKNITLINELDENFLLNCDSNMITTVIRNLVSNAIKFTPEGGSISVFADINKDDVILTIEDTGVGISENDIQKLFRIDVSHTTIGTGAEKGTGLGLILCKEFIDKHKGRIWVESEIGKGSKFRFSLPIIQETL